MLSAALTSADISECENINNGESCSPSMFQIILFFSSLYLVAIGQGGHKPCVQAFGADQYDSQDPDESRTKSPFFNWWYFCTAVGINITLIIVIYIEENLNWVLGFGIPCLVLLASLLVFLAGSRTYRYGIEKNKENRSSEQSKYLTGNPSGITMLQRVGTGMCTSVLSMIVAAIVEINRLETAKQYGIIDLPNVTVPISIWWLVPQYVPCGVSNVFTIVGLQEFFYDQVPGDFRSVGLALYLSVIGVGSFLSSLIVYVIDKITSRHGEESWFCSNRLILIIFIGSLLDLAQGFFAYLYFARLYVYRRQ